LERRIITCIICISSILSIAVIGGIATGTLWKNRITLKVFHAGSLTLPLEEIKTRFERDFASYRPPGSLIVYSVEVQLEPAGSVQCIRKITELGEEADVLASADYSLIPEMMIPEYAGWYLKFAKNRMVLAYTDKSQYADEVNSTNWYQILRRPDVRWGFANPNIDPCGYRALWVLQLAELEYGDYRVFEDLVEANSAITMTEEGDCYVYTAPEDLEPNTARIAIKDKSVELIASLELGGLGYAFEYLSIAKQHGLRFVELPESIDLSSETPAYMEIYGRMKAVTLKGNLTAMSIHYGVTVPKNAPNPELAERFVEYMINESGRTVLEEMGQSPITPSVASDFEKVPEILRPYSIDEED
jgi:molybdate/tungstate transport system substrate-binding protein